METITHNVVAVYIQILCFQFLFFPLNVLFTIIFAFLTHIIVDGFSNLTYHTPDAHKDDKFWLYWHIIIYTLSGLSIIIFIIPFWLSILFANLMDIWDWLIIRPIQKRKRKKDPNTKWGNRLYLHVSVDWVRQKLLFWLPQWNYKKSGIIIEILIISIFSFLISLHYI